MIDLFKDAIQDLEDIKAVREIEEATRRTLLNPIATTIKLSTVIDSDDLQEIIDDLEDE